MTTPVPESSMSFEDQFPVIESRALKNKLSNIMVTASNYPAGQPVPVKFVGPEFQTSTANYPGIYIAYAGMNRATDREHRGATNLEYAPPGYPTNVPVPDPDTNATVAWDTTGFDRWSSPYHVQDIPIPFNLDYQVAVVTSNYEQTFQIIAQMQRIDRLPVRFGYLEVPEDGTVRTLELIEEPDTSVIEDADGKRRVQTLYSVRVAAELSLYQIETLGRVASVNVDLTEIPYL